MTLLRRLFTRVAGSRESPPAPPPAPGATRGVSFTCNLCGVFNSAIARERVENRECPSCPHCGSSLRMRSLMYLLSMELFGKPLLLADFPLGKSIRGLGMSDWDGYALALSRQFAYVNTFFDREPRLDITNIGAEQVGAYDFMISSDVFEHIPLFQLDTAFANARRLLSGQGFLLLTVPYKKEAQTREHFPRLHEFSIVEKEGARMLVNKTADGVEETFSDLVFHGGDGMTLEMRVFCETDLLARLRRAGFSSVRTCPEHFPEFGILWPTDFDVPVVARA